MKIRKLAVLVLCMMLLSTSWTGAEASAAHKRPAQEGSTSYAFTWNEGSNFTVVEYWNAQSRAGCDYASNPWPQAELAAQRSYVLGARQVLRNELEMGNWIAGNRAGSSQVRIHGAETNCYKGHEDWPPHVHAFYLSIDSSGGWRHINSHHYPNAAGKIFENFVIPNLCGKTTSYRPAVGEWVDILDETCSAAWQQRYTESGDLELRRDGSAPVYVLRNKGSNGDLSSLDVLQSGSVLYSIDITQYDPIGFRMAANIKDHRNNQQVTETWWGDPGKGVNLAGHTVEPSGLAVPPTPTALPATPTAPSPAATATHTNVPPTPVATAAPPAATDVPAKTFTTAIADYEDDGYQDGKTLTTDHKTVWIGDNKHPRTSFAGLRFAGVSLPRGALIQSARLELYSIAADNTEFSVNIYGEASGDSARFSSRSLPSDRNRTAALVAYADPAGWAAGTWYGVDVTRVVQEIVNRGDWSNGNALALLIQGTSGDQGYRRGIKGIASWDDTNAARLVLSYSAGASQPAEPTATAPAPQATPTHTAAPPSPTATRTVPTATAPAPTSTPTTQPPPTGKVYYVATNGNDANPGTEALPWRTIGKAATMARAGETVYIKAGTYAEKLRPANSGAGGAWITFAAYPGHTVVLDGSRVSVGNWSGLVDVSGRSYIAVRGLTAQYSDYAGLFASNAQNILFQGNHTFHSYTSGIGVWNSTNVVVDGNDVENSNYGGGNEAVSFGGTSFFEIKNNRVHNPAATSSQPLKEGIDVKQGSHDGTVHHNEIYQMQKVALYVDSYDQHTYNVQVYANRLHDVRMGITLAAEAGGLLENVKVYNNVISNVYYAGIRTFGQVETTSHPMRNISYINNTVYGAGTGINVSNDQISGFTVANNILSQNTYAIELGAGVNVTLSNNLIDGSTRAKGATDITGNPLFIDPANGNFHLQSGSPAIDRASPNGAPATDYDGRMRPQGAGYDIGAFEAPSP